MHRKLFMSSPVLSGHFGLSSPFLPDGDGGDGGGGGGAGGGSGTGDALQQYLASSGLDPLKAVEALKNSRKWEDRAKANVPHEDHQKVVDELNQLRQQGMSDAQKAVETARSEGLAAGRAEAQIQYGTQLVQARFDALIAPRVLDAEGKPDDARRQALVEGLATAGYLKDDGSVDTDALTKWADTIAPPPATGNQNGSSGAGAAGGRWPSFGQGQTPPPPPAGAAAGDAEADRRWGSKQ